VFLKTKSVKALQLVNYTTGNYACKEKLALKLLVATLFPVFTNVMFSVARGITEKGQI
jgi:hypothetical protein